MSKIRKITVLLLAFAMAGTVVAQDGRDNGDGRMPNKTFSLGIFGAAHIDTTYKLNGTTLATDDENATYFGISMRLYPLLKGMLGFGVDAMLLDSGDNYSSWMMDLNILFRLPVARNLTLNAGLGWSQYMESYSINDEVYWGDIGYNIRVGAEFFVTGNVSINGDLKRTTFEYDNFLGNASRTYFNMQLGVNFWM